MSPTQQDTRPTLSVDARRDAAEREALDWFIRRTDGLDVADEAAFQAWLAADASHRAAFAHWQSDWDGLDLLPQAGLATLRANLAVDQHAAQSRQHAARAADALSGQRGLQSGAGDAGLSCAPGAEHRPASPARRAWLAGSGKTASRAALATLVLSATGAGTLAWLDATPPAAFAQRFTTARGEQRDVLLPDGSVLRLDTATRIDVALYAARREVRLLEGQAVFVVQGDAGRPFDVLAGPLRVTVVGTRFSVRHTPELAGDDGVRVAVEEGRVRVARMSALRAWFGASPADGQAMLLGAGEQIASNAAGELGQMSPVSAAGIAPWRDNRVSFDNTPLSQALAEFQRYGDVTLRAGTPAVAAMRITGTFDPRRLDNFTRVLPQVLPVRLEMRAGVNEIVDAR